MKREVKKICIFSNFVCFWENGIYELQPVKAVLTISALFLKMADLYRVFLDCIRVTPYDMIVFIVEMNF